MERLTESEEVVMKAVWDTQKEPMLSEVMTRVIDDYGKDWKPQTVSTFLAKLVRKNYLKLHREGKVYTYKILVTEKDYKRKLYKHLIDFWNHSDVTEFVMSMIENGDLDKSVLDQFMDR